ncbi:MAG: Serine-rich adhesin, platelet-type, partial [Candidatus Kaiserbacteria bacterium GW2011_GWC2_49_12]
DLSASPTRLETGTRIIKVLADIVGGSSYTYDIQIRRAADINVVDAELGQPILMTGTFAAGTGNTIAAGTLSIAKSADSPNTDIAVSATNVLMARFEVRAAGEDVKVEAVTVDVDQTAAGGMDNGKVFLNGTQIGSTKDVAAGGTEFTFGSSFIARHGQTEIIEIYGDAKETDATNFAAATTVDVGISVAAADTEGLSSGNTVTAISEVEGNSRTMTASSLSASKASGYGDQTMIAGTNNAKLGSFTLSAGSTEGININSIVVNLTSNESATITDLRLVDNSTGAQLGSTKPSPSTANTFSVNVTLPVSGSKTYDVVGNIKSGSNAGPWVAILDSTTGGNGAVTAQSTTIGSDVSLQTITVGSGTLTDAVGVSPDDANGVAGSSDVHVNFTVQELKVKVPANSATSVSAVTLKYKDAAGTIQSASAALALSTGAGQTHSTATFTGLTFYVPQNTEQNLDVYVSIPTIASGATAGRAITVLLDANEGFRAVDSSGTASTTLAAGDLNSADTSGKGTVYVRKSIPTLSSTPITSTLSNGTDQVLGRFNVTADAAGNIGWRPQR